MGFGNPIAAGSHHPAPSHPPASPASAAVPRKAAADIVTCDHRRIEDMNATLDARPPAVVFGDNLPQQKSGARERQIPQQDPLGSVPVEGHPTPAIAVSAQYETGAVTGGGLHHNPICRSQAAGGGGVGGIKVLRT
eukprot:CAMPEP_0181214266 /NCGR_PEP_ID=MMETSP1096-20121128/25355_1 /TAXON_ID=156174 ORGANISM="Chrysochromulina ericina, Strain CCMP281" /NCGR_SAMPLE_ID=MMETSP1096 /ASSEMBLY_ACC=CAM_ASM_000453 /LENGTH=135 /DNA_ID=CAMNT_0023305977 /DNA_START=431 /DNA_END=840 /DNA_ORIENTATION=-